MIHIFNFLLFIKIDILTRIRSYVVFIELKNYSLLKFINQKYIKEVF